MPGARGPWRAIVAALGVAAWLATPSEAAATPCRPERVAEAVATASQLAAAEPAAIASQVADAAEPRLAPPRAEDLFVPAPTSAAAPVRLLAPADARLVAGSEIALSWEPGPAFGALGDVDEWEAFWSLDDGATFPFRLTPHLDLDVRRVVVRVPDVPAPRARLLLRIGDEHRERGVLLPQRFTVTLAPAVATVLSSPAPRQLAAAAGEPALAREPGVVGWVEGSRRGADWHPVAVRSTPRLEASLQPHPPAGVDAAELPERTPKPAAASAATDIAPPLRLRVARSPAFSPALPVPADILLLGRRRNE